MRTDRPADPLLSAAVRHVEREIGAPLPDGYRSELLPQLPYWLQAVAGGLEAGALLFVDYGYPRREFYAPERTDGRSEEHQSELQSLMRISYAVFCLKTKNNIITR